MKGTVEENVKLKQIKIFAVVVQKKKKTHKKTKPKTREITGIS